VKSVFVPIPEGFRELGESLCFRTGCVEDELRFFAEVATVLAIAEVLG
jgi:hypothetical protein